MPISRERKLLFVHIPKTGGSSIEKALGLFSNWRVEDRERLFGLIQSPILKRQAFSSNFLQHLSLRDIQLVLPEWNKYYRFAFVRNPWDKLVSIYSNTDHNLLMQAQAQGIELKGIEFPEFIHRIAEIQHIHLLPQYDFIYAENGQCLVNFIGRFEQLQEDFAQVCQTLNLDIQLPHHNVSVHTPYQDYYTEESKAWVGERYQVDIETFNYHF